jgi:hypothetical protein
LTISFQPRLDSVRNKGSSRRRVPKLVKNSHWSNQGIVRKLLKDDLF